MTLKRFAFHAAIARFGINLDDLTWGDAYLEKLLKSLGVTRENLDLDQFALDHFNLFFGYIQAKKIEDNLPTIETETKALAKAQEAARKLAEALREVQSTGEAGKRLVEDAQFLPRFHFQMGEIRLGDFMVDRPYEPLKPLHELLKDLQTALHRAKIEKPRPYVPPGNISNLDKKASADAWTRFYAKSDDQEERAERRKAQHPRSEKSALKHFSYDLRHFWVKYSDRPFTEGRYETAIRTNSSFTVDFAEIFLKSIGAKYPRSLIINKIREMKEATNADATNEAMS